MEAPVLAAMIAATAALGAAIVSLVAQKHTATLQHELAQRREEAQRETDLQRVMNRYRQPLLQAATDLQSRLYNIVRGKLLQTYGRGTPDEQQYTFENSLFVFGEYFGWVEALRREVQFLDIGGDRDNRMVQERIERVTSEFLTSDLEREFRLFRGQQRAIGEVMLVPRSSGDSLECIGMATFARRLADPEFSRWFEGLRNDLVEMSQHSAVWSTRIENIQGALIDLMDALDPEGVRIPADRRKKLSEPEP